MGVQHIRCPCCRERIQVHVTDEGVIRAIASKGSRRARGTQSSCNKHTECTGADILRGPENTIPRTKRDLSAPTIHLHERAYLDGRFHTTYAVSKPVVMDPATRRCAAREELEARLTKKARRGYGPARPFQYSTVKALQRILEREEDA
jgi:hypothetical protein